MIIKSSGYWNKQHCLEEAKKFSHRSEFKSKSPTAYRKCVEKKWLKEATSHMEKIKRYSLKDAQKIAKKRKGKCISKSFKGVQYRLVWECKQGHKWKATFHQVRSQNTWCDKCIRLKLSDHRKHALIKKLHSFYNTYKRAPKRREFDKFEVGLGSSGATRTYWGNYNNFLESNGYGRNYGIFGQVWRVWEKIVLKILKETYPGQIVYSQYYDSKTRTIIDYFIPSLGIAVDAKTSNYDIESRNTQYKKYLSIYKKIKFYCLFNDNAQQEQKGIQYIYASEVIKNLKNEKLKKDIRFLLSKNDQYRSEFGLITKEILLDELKKLSRELGRTPKMREYNNDKRFSNSSTVIKIFGSWNTALEEGGLSPRKTFSSKISKQYAIKEFKKTIADYKRDNKRVPGFKEYQKLANTAEYLSWKIIREKTGKTYSELIKHLGYKVNKRVIIATLSTDDVKGIIKSKGLVYISGKYVNEDSLFKVKCIKHGIIRTSRFASIKKSKTACSKCRDELLATKFRGSLMKVENNALKLGLTLEEGQVYKLARTRMNFRCLKCGYSFVTTPNSIQQGNGCPKCRFKKI